jgi:hypothetical protein
MDTDKLDDDYVQGSRGRDVWKVNGDVNLNDHNAHVGDRSHHSRAKNTECTQSGTYYATNDNDNGHLYGGGDNTFYDSYGADYGDDEDKDGANHFYNYHNM